MLSFPIKCDVEATVKKLTYVISHTLFRDNQQLKRKYFSDDFTHNDSIHLAVYLFTMNRLPGGLPNKKFTYGLFTGEPEIFMDVANSFINYFNGDGPPAKIKVTLRDIRPTLTLSDLTFEFFDLVDDCHKIKLYNRKDFQRLISILDTKSLAQLVDSFSRDFNTCDRKTQIKFIKKYLNAALKVKEIEDGRPAIRRKAAIAGKNTDIFSEIEHYTPRFHRTCYSYHTHLNIIKNWDYEKNKIPAQKIESMIEDYEAERLCSFFKHSYDYSIFILEENNITGEKLESILKYMLKNYEFKQLSSLEEFARLLSEEMPLEWCVQLAGVEDAPPPF